MGSAMGIPRGSRDRDDRCHVVGHDQMDRRSRAEVERFVARRRLKEFR